MNAYMNERKIEKGNNITTHIDHKLHKYLCEITTLNCVK